MTSHQANPSTPARFLADGYDVIKGVLDAEDVSEARLVAADAMGESDEMLPSALLHQTRLTKVLTHPRVLDYLRELFDGKYTFYPNITVRKDVFVDWHIDDAFVGPHRQNIWRPDFLHLQGAVYLQPNDDQAGGAIDVVPGSHLISVDGHGTAEPEYRPLLSKAITVEAEAGDLLLWHARTVHRSTPRRQAISESKYGIFFSAGRLDTYFANYFLTHLAGKRVLRGETRKAEFPRHVDTSNLRYPEDFPDALRESLEAQGTSFTTLFPWPPAWSR